MPPTPTTCHPHHGTHPHHSSNPPLPRVADNATLAGAKVLIFLDLTVACRARSEVRNRYTVERCFFLSVRLSYRGTWPTPSDYGSLGKRRHSGGNFSLESPSHSINLQRSSSIPLSPRPFFRNFSLYSSVVMPRGGFLAGGKFSEGILCYTAPRVISNPMLLNFVHVVR